MTDDKVYEILHGLFEGPCNVGFDEYMCDAGDWCETHCGEVPGAECWKRFFQLKMAELYQG